MKIIQTKLQSGNASQVAWIDCDGFDLKVGMYVTLKDSDDSAKRWRIESLGKIADKADIAGKRAGTWFNTDFVRKGKSWVNASGN